MKKNFTKNYFKQYNLKESNELPSLFQKDFLFQNLDKTANSNLKKTKNSQNNKNKSNLFAQNKQGILVKKGNEMGRFNMGSTIVMIFEVEENFELNVENGDRVVYGQRIGVHKKNKTI